MSSLMLVDTGEVKVLDLFVSAASTNLKVILFKNNYTPVAASAWADLVESDFPGYGRATAAFAAAATVAGKGTITDGARRDFTCTGGGASQVAYGYAVVWTTGGTPIVLWAERFDTPYTILNNGDGVGVTAKFNLEHA